MVNATEREFLGALHALSGLLAVWVLLAYHLQGDAPTLVGRAIASGATCLGAFGLAVILCRVIEEPWRQRSRVRTNTLVRKEGPALVGR
jgi:hypothetical protein